MALRLITESEFEKEVLRSELPVLVDLYADWCAPCKQLTPILEEIAVELEAKVRIVRVDVEQSPALAQGFRVQSIPMMILINGGRPVDQIVGLADKATILSMLEPVLPARGIEITPKELATLISTGQALAVDVRDESAFGRYRIPGALHLPADDLVERLGELKSGDGRLRVVYGRSTDDAKQLAEKARELGADVSFLVGGFLHWEADGLDVERGG